MEVQWPDGRFITRRMPDIRAATLLQEVKESAQSGGRLCYPEGSQRTGYDGPPGDADGLPEGVYKFYPSAAHGVLFSIFYPSAAHALLLHTSRASSNCIETASSSQSLPARLGSEDQLVSPLHLTPQIPKSRLTRTIGGKVAASGRPSLL